MSDTHRHPHARPPLGPLAQSAAYRLIWALSASTLLWLAVWWALS